MVDFIDFLLLMLKVGEKKLPRKMPYYAIPLVAITFEHSTILEVQWREL